MRCAHKGCQERATHYVSVICCRLVATPEEIKAYRHGLSDARGYLPSRDDLERHFGTETENPDGYYCATHKGGRMHPEGWYVVERKASKLPA